MDKIRLDFLHCGLEMYKIRLGFFYCGLEMDGFRPFFLHCGLDFVKNMGCFLMQKLLGGLDFLGFWVFL